MVSWFSMLSVALSENAARLEVNFQKHSGTLNLVTYKQTLAKSISQTKSFFRTSWRKGLSSKASVTWVPALVCWSDRLHIETAPPGERLVVTSLISQTCGALCTIVLLSVVQGHVSTFAGPVSSLYFCPILGEEGLRTLYVACALYSLCVVRRSGDIHDGKPVTPGRRKFRHPFACFPMDVELSVRKTKCGRYSNQLMCAIGLCASSIRPNH